MSYQETFSSFYTEFSSRVAFRARSAAVPAQDVEDIIQETWTGFWAWLKKRDDRNPEQHVGMLLEFAGWRIKDYFSDRNAAPILMEMPESVPVSDSSVILRIQTEQECRRSSEFFSQLAGMSGGNILRLLTEAADKRGMTEPSHRYSLVRDYLEQNVPSAERAALSSELVARLPSRHSLDAGVDRLTKSWNGLAHEWGIRPLAKARAAPRQKKVPATRDVCRLLHWAVSQTCPITLLERLGNPLP